MASGKTRGAFEEQLEHLGLVRFAGGEKYRYWTLPGCHRGVRGVGWRTSKRTVRLVERVDGAGGIFDQPLGEEHYYGKLRPEAPMQALEVLQRRCRR